MGSIFISYRRQDAAAAAGRLYDGLVARYGASQVVFDLANLEVGASFADQLQDAVSACEVMLVLIGPLWLTATDSQDRRRLDDPYDFIRHEVAAALRLRKPVVPVLVGGAAMPYSDALPEDLRDLVRRQAVELSDQRWRHDLEQLTSVIDRLIGGPATAAPSSGRRSLSFIERLSAAWRVISGDETSRGAQVPEAPPPVQTTALPVSPKPAATDQAPTPGPRHDVFISYAIEDRGRADDIVRTLEDNGRRCWVAHRDISGGERSWPATIVGAIASSRVLVLLVTQHSVGSKQVLREVTIADNENIPIMPLRTDTAPLSADLQYFLSAAQRLDVAGLPWEHALSRLHSAVRQQLA